MTDTPPILRFDQFTLDRADRRLLRDGQPVEVGSRYLDALVLLVEARGSLVTKDRFMDEIWSGVPVTDEALTQCIRTLRRALGDDAVNPRYIATVPKHGYRFVGSLDGEEPDRSPVTAPVVTSTGRLAAAGTIGGALAGLGGGLLYGLLLSAQDGGAGGAVFLTVLALCLAVGVLGGAGVGAGMAIASGLRGRTPMALVVGGAIGGMVVGALGRLVGMDLFHVLAGVGVGPVTGIVEGALIGLATGAACVLALRVSRRLAVPLAASVGAAGGLLVALTGGRLMAGSLVLLDRSVAQSRFGLDAMGALLGEPQFGPLSLLASSALEAAVFTTCVALAVRRA